MKAGFGVLFLIGALAVLAGGLAGGQVFVHSGSTLLGVAAGLAVTALVGLASRPLVRRLGGVSGRVFGEFRGAIDESEFVETLEVVADSSPRGVIERGVSRSPDRVAGSIRSMLGGGGRSDDPARGQRRRGKR